MLPIGDGCLVAFWPPVDDMGEFSDVLVTVLGLTEKSVDKVVLVPVNDGLALVFVAVVSVTRKLEVIAMLVTEVWLLVVKVVLVGL